MTLTARILAVLAQHKDCPLTSSLIAGAVNETRRTVVAALNQLATEGRAHVVGSTPTGAAEWALIG